MSGKRDKIADSDRFSIVYPYLNRCAKCNSSQEIALHEIFGGTSNRPKSKEDGMIAPLCHYHHNGSNQGVHFNKVLDTELKIKGQKAWEANYIKENSSDSEEARSAFIKRYGRNYVEED